MANALDEAEETAAQPEDAPASAQEDGPSVASGSPSLDTEQPDLSVPESVPESAPESAPDEPAPTESAPAQTPPAKTPLVPDPIPAPAASAPEAPAAPPPPEPAKPESAHGIIPMPEHTTPPADAQSHPAATLKNRFLIFPAMPLTDLDSPTATAYSVEDRREPGRQLFALICTPGLPTRTRAMADLRSLTIHGLMPLVDHGPVFWGPLGQSCLAVIYERPVGGRLIDAFQDQKVKINEYEIARRIIEPIAHALQEMSAMGIAHRAVRVDNLFFMDKERRELVLGECVTTPPGFDQPVIYEPLERAYAMPSGRGYGYTEDDIYALGVTTVFLLLGYNPVHKLKSDRLLAAKSELGSYQCMCGHERIPMPLIEPLRGMLSDDPRERWNIDAMNSWLSGQKKTPIQRRTATKSKVAFKFAGHDHITTITLAQAFSKNIADAVKVIKNGKLELWLRQGMNNPTMADGIVATVAVVKVHEGSPDGSDDILVSKICMRLDPSAPVRFKGMAFMPDGFGPAMAVEYLRKGNMQIPGELLVRDLLGYWFASQEVPSADFASMDRTFQSLRNFAKINEMGFGLERCLYELNRTLPCQSEMFQQAYVDHIDELLPALDAAAEFIDKRSRPIDKHIAAFIATHFKFDIQPHLKALSDPKEETALIGMLSLFALMQWRMKVDTLFGLSSWLGGLLQPAIGTYHSRTTRQAIEREIPALVRQGSLPDLFDLIDNAERRAKDNHAFEDAQLTFAHAEIEIQGMVGEEVDQQKIAIESGEKVTAMTAVMIGMIATTVIIIVKAV